VNTRLRDTTLLQLKAAEVALSESDLLILHALTPHTYYSRVAFLVLAIKPIGITQGIR
jgi:hypothetical protein